MAAFLRNRAGLLLSTSYVFVHPSSLFLATLRPRPKNEFVALKLVEATDGFQIEDSNLFQNILFFFFFAHYIFEAGSFARPAELHVCK